MFSKKILVCRSQPDQLWDKTWLKKNVPVMLDGFQKRLHIPFIQMSLFITRIIIFRSSLIAKNCKIFPSLRCCKTITRLFTFCQRWAIGQLKLSNLMVSVKAGQNLRKDEEKIDFEQKSLYMFSMIHRRSKHLSFKFKRNFHSFSFDVNASYRYCTRPTRLNFHLHDITRGITFQTKPDFILYNYKLKNIWARLEKLALQ